MKKISVPLLAISIALLSGCQKSDESLRDQDLKAGYLKNEYLQHKPNAEVKGCSIMQITYPVGPGNDILEFTYNSSGDPVSAKRLLGGHTGYPNYAFKYDDKNRLTEFIGPYDGNAVAENWHKYFYDNEGNIILDSTYIFPRIVNGFPENAYMRQLTFYTYDNKRRIIRDSTVFSSPLPAVVHSYAYDANGNKLGNVYDDKININRTNEIWMFLNRDYSVNNPFRSDGYNATGLPASFHLSLGGTHFEFLGNDYQQAQISYACDAITDRGKK